MTALFPCIACHHLVSRKAIACPNCGHPVRGVLGLLRVIAIALVVVAITLVLALLTVLVMLAALLGLLPH
jgi:hypothetical protein